VNGIVAQNEKAMGHARRRFKKSRYECSGTVQIYAAEAGTPMTTMGMNVKKGARRPVTRLRSLPHRIRSDLRAYARMSLIVFVSNNLVFANEKHHSALPVVGCRCDQETDPLVGKWVGTVEIRSNFIEKIATNFQANIHCRGPR
jgi:hypothetical protein